MNNEVLVINKKIDDIKDKESLNSLNFNDVFSKLNYQDQLYCLVESLKIQRKKLKNLNKLKNSCEAMYKIEKVSESEMIFISKECKLQRKKVNMILEEIQKVNDNIFSIKDIEVDLNDFEYINSILDFDLEEEEKKINSTDLIDQKIFIVNDIRKNISEKYVIISSLYKNYKNIDGNYEEFEKIKKEYKYSLNLLHQFNEMYYKLLNIYNTYNNTLNAEEKLEDNIDIDEILSKVNNIINSEEDNKIKYKNICSQILKLKSVIKNKDMSTEDEEILTLELDKLKIEKQQLEIINNKKDIISDDITVDLNNYSYINCILGFDLEEKLENINNILDEKEKYKQICDIRDNINKKYIYLNREIKQLKTNKNLFNEDLIKERKYLSKLLEKLNAKARQQKLLVNSIIRSEKRQNDTDLKSSIYEGYNDDINDPNYLKYRYIRLKITECIDILNSGIDMNEILMIINELVNDILDTCIDYEKIETEINRLKDSIKYKAREYDKKDLVRKELKKMNNRIKYIEEQKNNTLYEDENIENKKLYEVFKYFIFEKKNLIYVKEMLLERKDLCYLINEHNKYLFEEVIDKYTNVILNGNNNEVCYFQSLIDSYVDIINELENKELMLILNKKLQKAFFRTNNLITTNFDKEKLERSNYIIISQLNKIKTEKEELGSLSNLRNIISNNSNYEKNNKCIITIDDEETNIFENAFSIEQLNDGKYEVIFYISDVIGSMSKLNLNQLFYKELNRKRLIEKNISIDKISLNEGKATKAFAYHFILNDNMDVINFDLKKEEIVVTKNIKNSEIENNFYNTYPSNIKNTIDLFLNLGGVINKSSYHHYNLLREEGKVTFLNSEFMIFLNSQVTNYCNQNNIPFICNTTIANDDLEETIIDNDLDFYNIDEQVFISNCNDIKKGEFLYLDQNTTDSYERYGRVSNPCRKYVSLLNQLMNSLFIIDEKKLSEKEKCDILLCLNNICNKLNVKSSTQKCLTLVKKD